MTYFASDSRMKDPMLSSLAITHSDVSRNQGEYEMDVGLITSGQYPSIRFTNKICDNIWGPWNEGVCQTAIIQ